jgi:capsular exopolysaccharide synthesis family protein
MMALPQAGQHSEREMDMRYYADLLWRSRVLIAASLVGGLMLGWLGAEAQTPQYQARALLQVAPPNPTSIGVADAIAQTGNIVRDRQFFNTQLSVLYSRELARRAGERLKLAEQPGFPKGADVAGLFLSHLQIEPLPDTFVVEVRVNHTDPKDAALWANTLADVYIDSAIEGHVEAAKRAYNWVSERLADVQRTMQSTQDKLLKSYQGQEMFVAEGGVSAVASSIGKLNEDQVGATAQRIALEAQLAEIANMRKRGQSLETVPQVSHDANFQELSAKSQQLQLELTRLKAKYRDAHPEIQKVQVQLDQIRKARESRIRQIEGGLEAEYRQLQRREAELKEAIEAQKGQAVAQSQKLSELDTLKRQADSANNLYTVLLQKLNETNIAGSIQNNNVLLIDRAVPPTSPVFPEKRRVAAVGAIAGLLLGGAFVFLRDYFGNTIKDVEDVERYLHLEVLAAVPRFGKDNQQLATEAYQTLRTALLFARKGEHGQVILVTGTAPGEGKTTTVLNLAKLLATSGESTVVVDGDLRRPTVHQRLGTPREPGLTDLITRQLDLTSLVHATATKSLSILPSGPTPPSSPAVLARSEVSESLDRLRHHFRWVLVDSPPLASVTDALLLAQHADVALLVVQHDKVDKKVVKRSLAALRRVAPNVLGAVLNAIDVKSTSHYYYTYSEKEKAARSERKEGLARGDTLPVRKEASPRREPQPQAQPQRTTRPVPATVE